MSVPGIAAWLALAWLLAATPALGAGKRDAPKSWPPAGGKGSLFVHFGEEHVNDAETQSGPS